jgi:hypothetical protein
MKKLLILSLLIALVIGCQTIRLENRLKANIAQWYDLHGLLMDTQAPEEFAHQKGVTERQLFLRLPEAKQLEYIKIFWTIRWEGMEKEFAERLTYAQFQCRRENAKQPWLTDRGRLLLLCSYPFDVRVMHDGELVPDFDEFAGGIGDWYQTWYYQWGRTFVAYTFEYRSPHRWYLVETLATVTEQRGFEDYCREELAPTYNGWEQAFGTIF